MDTPVVAEFIGQLLRASWQASVLALVVWLVIRALGDHLDARWRCRLWMLVIVRLAWPVSLPSPVSLFNVVDLSPVGIEGSHERSLTRLEALETPWVQWVWSLVAVVLLARMLAAVVWATWIRWSARPLDSWETWWILQNCKADTRLDTPLAILESTRVKGPCVLGFLRPRLVLPKGIIRELSSAELRLVFLHELAHLSRRDLALNWVLAAVETIHWFNPLVWFVTRRLRADREEDCDARALASQPEAGRAYGEVILKLLERVPAGAVAAASPAGVQMLGSGEEDIGPLLHRLHAIKRFRPGARTWLVGFGTWLAVALIGLTDAEPRPVVELAGASAVELASGRPA